MEAVQADIWQYIDPDVPEADLPKLTEPDNNKKPSVKDIKIGANALTDLNECELDIYHLLLRDYQRDLDKYESKRRALKDIRGRILRSVTKELLPVTERKGSAHSMLVALKRRITPLYEEEMARRYRSLMRGPRGMDVDRWLLRLEAVYNACSDLKLAEVHGDRAAIDFVKVLEAEEPGFSMIWRDRIIMREFPGFHEMIQAYRRWCSAQNPWWDTASATTFKGHSYGKSNQPNQRSQQSSLSRGRGRCFRPSGHRS